MSKRLGVGFVVSGFRDARVHLESWTGVRDADVRGVWSPNAAQAAETGAFARRLDIGAAKPYPSITAMIADPSISALWLCGPARARLEHMEEIADAVIRAKGKLLAVASETPLAPTVAEAQRVTALAAHAGLKHGYLEPRVFAPEIVNDKRELWTGAAASGRPHLARATVPPALENRAAFDSLCQGVLAARFLLTEPGAFLTTLRPLRVTGEITAHSAAIAVEFAAPEGTIVRGEVSVSASADEVDGCAASNQHYVRAFLGLDEPLLTFEDGFEVVRLVMAAYQSAEEGRTLDYPPPGLETFVPAVAQDR